MKALNVTGRSPIRSPGRRAIFAMLLRWILASLLSHRSPTPIPWGTWLWLETLSVGLTVQGHIRTG